MLVVRQFSSVVFEAREEIALKVDGSGSISDDFLLHCKSPLSPTTTSSSSQSSLTDPIGDDEALSEDVTQSRRSKGDSIGRWVHLLLGRCVLAANRVYSSFYD